MRYFGERLGAGRVVEQQAMAVVVEIADQRHVDAHAVELLADLRHTGGGFRGIHRDPHQFGAGAGQFGTLHGRRHVVGGIGVGHRLDDDRGMSSDDHSTDPNRTHGAALDTLTHACSLIRLLDRHARNVIPLRG